VRWSWWSWKGGRHGAVLRPWAEIKMIEELNVRQVLFDAKKQTA